MVMIISSDNKKFILDNDIAELSLTLKILLNPNFHQGFIKLPIHSFYLSKVISFMHYKFHTIKNENIEIFQIDDDEAENLLEIASYLRI